MKLILAQWLHHARPHLWSAALLALKLLAIFAFTSGVTAPFIYQNF